MTRKLSPIALLCCFGCAPDEAYLVIEATFPASSTEDFGHIVVRRVGGPAADGEPLPFPEGQRRLRVSVHAEDEELDAPIEIQFRRCASTDAESCEFIASVEVEQVWQKDAVRELCFDLNVLESRRLAAFDADAAELPPGVMRCED